MDLYLIDDNATVFSTIDGVIKLLKEENKYEQNSELYRIDASGYGKLKTGNLTENIYFDLPLSEAFVTAITQSVTGDKKIFLIDLALNAKDNSAVTDVYILRKEGAVFTASAATEIINILKEANNTIKIIVISAIPDMLDDHELWKKHIQDGIHNKSWLDDIQFIPTEYIYEAPNNDECLKLLKDSTISNIRGEK